MGGGRCEDDSVFQLREEGEPERVVLVHVQNSRNTDLSALCLVCLQRCVTEEEFILIFKKVRDLFFILFLAQTALAAVSADELTAAGEAIDGQTAVVSAAFTFCHRGGELKLVDLLDGEHRGFGTFHIALSCDEGGSEGSHDTGDIRTDGLAAGDLLKTSENCVVVEGTALDNDVAWPSSDGVGNLDDLKQSVLDDGVGKASGDIGDGCTLFLGLFYVGVHEYGTAGTQVDGILGKERGLREILDAVV